MTPTLRAELDRIEDFLMGDEGKQLADVLSALRGPDHREDGYKNATTAHIRVAAFPRLAKRDKVPYGELDGSALDNWSFARTSTFEAPPSPYGDEFVAHFPSHIYFAAKVLELIK